MYGAPLEPRIPLVLFVLPCLVVKGTSSASWEVERFVFTDSSMLSGAPMTASFLSECGARFRSRGASRRSAAVFRA